MNFWLFWLFTSILGYFEVVFLKSIVGQNEIVGLLNAILFSLGSLVLFIVLEKRGIID